MEAIRSTDEELTLADASWRDLRSFLTLERSCFGRDAWPWLDVLDALTSAGTVRIKALLGDQLVGYVIGDKRRDRQIGWIASICVHPSQRGSGIGATLLAACEQALHTPKVRLVVRPSNEAALELYRAAGYRKVGIWPAYYRDKEDGLLMERVITQLKDRIPV
jgi:ribosomal-protein-alanine N-acetyltransferase